MKRDDQKHCVMVVGTPEAITDLKQNNNTIWHDPSVHKACTVINLNHFVTKHSYKLCQHCYYCGLTRSLPTNQKSGGRLVQLIIFLQDDASCIMLLL